MSTLRLDSPLSEEKATARVDTTADPTGTPPDFVLTARYARPAGDAVWQTGTWDGAYASGTATAVSPQIVAGLAAAASTTYDLFVRWTIPGERPIKRVCTVSVPA